MTLSYGLWDTYVHEVHIMYLHESLRHDYMLSYAIICVVTSYISVLL